jgi:hypothetical protein
MNEEPHKTYTIEDLFKMAQTKKKYQSNGRGVGWWLTLWGLIFFAFGKLTPLYNWAMWTFCIVGFVVTLIGTFALGLSFDKYKEA